MTSFVTGSFVKFRPQSTNFINLTNPRAVLEKKMSKFACLTKSQTIRIFYNNKTYDLDVVQLQAAGNDISAVTIIEVDINVSFEAPADYVDPATQPESTQANFGQGLIESPMVLVLERLSNMANQDTRSQSTQLSLPPQASPKQMTLDGMPHHYSSRRHLYPRRQANADRPEVWLCYGGDIDGLHRLVQ